MTAHVMTTLMLLTFWKYYIHFFYIDPLLNIKRLNENSLTQPWGK